MSSTPDPPPPLPAGTLPSGSIDDIRYLVVFAKVVETGSFSRAARALGLSTATTSQHVGRLESRLGAALLYRNTRKLSLTTEGERLLDTARSMLALYEDGVVGFRQSASKRPRLRIAMPAVLHRSRLMPALAGFMADHPEIEYRLHSSENRHDLVGESIDVAFRAGALADSGLRARKVFDISRLTVASPALLRDAPALSHPSQLGHLPWIGLSMRAHRRCYLGPSGERVEFDYTPRIITDSVEAGMELARQGLGLVAPTDFLLRGESERSGLQQVLPEWKLEPLPVHAVWPANLSRHSLAHALVETLCTAFDEFPPPDG